jgi:hypothetical protein
VHCKRDRFDTYVGRPSVWGNPFSVEQYGRGRALERYAEWLETQHALKARAKRELRGKVLACWCAPSGGIDADDRLICHAQLLSRIANA